MLGLPVAAQVFRCVNGNATSFSDKPCTDGAGSAVRTSAAAASGNLDFQVLTRHYAVAGSNLQEAWRSMRANGPQGWAGWARWNVSYDYKSAQRPRGCEISSVDVRVRSDILMPQWEQLPSAPPADQARWRSMYDNLKRHEDGHVQHGREFALLLKERLLGLGVVACDELKARAQREYDQLYANLKKRDQEYDARTDHGLRQDNPR